MYLLADVLESESTINPSSSPCQQVGETIIHQNHAWVNIRFMPHYCAFLFLIRYCRNGKRTTRGCLACNLWFLSDHMLQTMARMFVS